jgi:hypothetical protein
MANTFAGLFLWLLQTTVSKDAVSQHGTDVALRVTEIKGGRSGVTLSSFLMTLLPLPYNTQKAHLWFFFRMNFFKKFRILKIIPQFPWGLVPGAPQNLSLTLCHL